MCKYLLTRWGQVESRVLPTSIPDEPLAGTATAALAAVREGRWRTASIAGDRLVAGPLPASFTGLSEAPLRAGEGQSETLAM